MKWPIGAGGKGNAGVAQVIQQTPGAIGYLEQNYADKNKIQYGAVENTSGQVREGLPADCFGRRRRRGRRIEGARPRGQHLEPEGRRGYPIASFTYLIVYKDLKNLKSKEQAEALVSS